MTQRFDEAFGAASRLSPAEQDALADEAHEDYVRGRTEPLDLDRR